VWERLHYDWSDPNHVILTTIDSNLWGGASGHTYTFTRQPNSSTDVDVEVLSEKTTIRSSDNSVVCVLSAGSILLIAPRPLDPEAA